MSFVHLHAHTEYSLLDGLSKIGDYVGRVKELGMSAAAITDHGCMHGAVQFYSACKKAGIKPLIGIEAYEAPTTMSEKDKNNKYYHLILIAKNEVGYKNLCILSTRSYTEGFYGKPRIDRTILKEHSEGLICLSGCVAGRIPQDILAGNLQAAEADMLWYKRVFGDDFYVEVQNHGLKDEAVAFEKAIKLAAKNNIKVVCTNDSHYVRSEDKEAHQWLLCMQTDKKLNDPDKLVYTGDYSIKSEEEMRELFPDNPEFFDVTQEIADKCEFEFKFAESPADYRMPRVDMPDSYNKDYLQYLKDEAYKGLDKRYPMGHPERAQAEKNLKYELSVVGQMGFAEYFLDTRKTIMWARSHGILVGPGRGSGAGSTMNYCLGITDLDPIKYGLLFERFLNPERISMPDIDVDYDYAYKDAVVASEAESNGKDKFCKIVTFGTMKAKSVLKGCAKVAGYPVSVGVDLAGMIPDDMTLKEAWDANPDLRAYVASDKSYEKLWDICLKLEGTKKSRGSHACGHIPTPQPCEELFPCVVDSETGYLVCQYDMVEAEHLGNLKKDLLMLRNLTVINTASKLIMERYEKDIPLWTDEILNDEKALALIASGDTAGVFQLESEGMAKMLKDLKPQSFEDIIAAVSLYRPGPMDFIPDFIKGKTLPSSIKYLTPQLEPILKATYGQIVYQEQVMQIVRDLGGFSMARADVVRKAMGGSRPVVWKHAA